MGIEYQGLSGDITFSVANSSTNVVLITLQVRDNDGKNVAEPVMVDVWLSILATGVVSTNAPSGNFDMSSEGSLVFPASATTSIKISILTNATGGAVLTLTDTEGTSGACLYYVCANHPYSGRMSMSDQMTAALFA